MWKTLEIKNLGEYHDLCSKTDVLLLCDFFEKFIDTCLIQYKLDPCNYFSSPGLSWDAMLRFTGIKLEKIHDIDVHLFLEKGMRGGVSCISKKYAKSDENTKIMYWDMNNLYGTVMSFSYLPYGGFKFLSEKEINVFDLSSIAENSLVEYILEADLEYYKELHIYTMIIHYVLKKIEISSDKLSRYCKDIADCYGIKNGGVKKLIPNLGEKVKYVVQYKDLKYYLSLGMKLIKIHRILSFKQSNWLKSYIDFNTKKRQESPDEFNKNLYKLFVNCIYGKSCENIRRRISVKLINDKKTYKKCVNKPNFVSQKTFNKNFVGVHSSKKVLTLNKPIYIGFCILELSKLLMYQFHYDYVLKTFNDAKLLFTDTDSLVYKIKDGNVYKQCFKDKHLFDFSGYSKDSMYYDDSNKKALDKMKDEFNDVKIDEFVGLKSKMYSLIACNDKEVNKAKGVNLKLRHKEYVDVLFNRKVVRHKMKRIQINLHQVGTCDLNKISLSCFDDKRYVLDDRTNTLAYFHKDININREY